MILFIGNALRKKGRSGSYTEFLVEQLGQHLTDEVRLVSGYKNKILRLLHAIFFLAVHQRKIKLVVIDTFSTSAFYYAYFSAQVCRLLSKRYMLVLHGGNLPDRYSKSKQRVTKLFNHALKIISPSFYLFDFFQKKGFDVQVITNSISLEDYPFKKRSHVQPRILWVRAFDAIYNPVLAIKVLKIIRAKYPQAHLTMIGPAKDQSFEASKQFAQANGVFDAVTFTGLLTRDQWVKESRSHDFFLNTTTIDNQPVSLLEAMALGLLVISTEVGGIPFLIDHDQNGFLVPSDNAEAMAHQIFELMEKPDTELEKISSNARIFAEGFDWQKVKAQWMNLIESNV